MITVSVKEDSGEVSFNFNTFSPPDTLALLEDIGSMALVLNDGVNPLKVLDDTTCPIAIGQTGVSGVTGVNVATINVSDHDGESRVLPAGRYSVSLRDAEVNGDSLDGIIFAELVVGGVAADVVAMDGTAVDSSVDIVDLVQKILAIVGGERSLNLTNGQMTLAKNTAYAVVLVAKDESGNPVTDADTPIVSLEDA